MGQTRGSAGAAEARTTAGPRLIEGAGTRAPAAVSRAAGKTAVMVLHVSECYREIQAPRSRLIDRDAPGMAPYACTTELGSLKAGRQAPLPEAGLDTWEEAETGELL